MEAHRVSVWWIVVALVAAACGAQAFDPGSYQLLFHESGRIEQTPVPPFGSPGGKPRYTTAVKGGLTVLGKGHLVYFVQRGRVTIYRPGEGLLIRLPYDTRAIDDDADGTQKADLSKAPPGAYRDRPMVMAIRDPRMLLRWDEAASRPALQPDFGFLDADLQRLHAYVAVGYLETSPDLSTVFHDAEAYLDTATAAEAMPGLAAMRGIAPPSRPSTEPPVPDDASPDAIARLGAQRYAQAVALPKRTASIVCSADNRVAYIEQIDGPRLKLVVTGRAIGRYREFGRFGPFDTTLVDGPATHLPHGIDDPYFLFLPLTGPVRFIRMQQTVWDLGRLWGICDYQLSPTSADG